LVTFFTFFWLILATVAPMAWNFARCVFSPFGGGAPRGSSSSSQNLYCTYYSVATDIGALHWIPQIQNLPTIVSEVLCFANALVHYFLYFSRIKQALLWPGFQNNGLTSDRWSLHILLAFNSNAKQLRFHYSIYVKRTMKLTYILLVDLLLHVSSTLELHFWNPSPLSNWLPMGCAMGP